jgi:hypothetical protein
VCGVRCKAARPVSHKLAMAHLQSRQHANHTQQPAGAQLEQLSQGQPQAVSKQVACKGTDNAN